jgi:hypothetical protein
MMMMMTTTMAKQPHASFQRGGGMLTMNLSLQVGADSHNLTFRKQFGRFIQPYGACENLKTRLKFSFSCVP